MKLKFIRNWRQCLFKRFRSFIVKTRAEKLEEIFPKYNNKKFLHTTFLHSNLQSFVEGERSMKQSKILINHKIDTICQVVKKKKEIR
jgi:hypothetical protein